MAGLYNPARFMRPLTAILALLTGVAGWFYLFFSRAARRLGGVEQQRANRWRNRLRRVNGIVMIVLAASYMAARMPPMKTCTRRNSS